MSQYLYSNETLWNNSYLLLNDSATYAPGETVQDAKPFGLTRLQAVGITLGTMALAVALFGAVILYLLCLLRRKDAQQFQPMEMQSL